jgi:hypothetical protein
MLSVTYAEYQSCLIVSYKPFCAECRYAECRYAERRYAECRSTLFLPLRMQKNELLVSMLLILPSLSLMKTKRKLDRLALPTLSSLI